MKLILLIDISTWKGHHRIYFQKVLLALIQEDFYVYASCEDNVNLNKWIRELKLQNCQVLDSNLSFIDKSIFKILSFIDSICLRLYPNTYIQYTSIVSLLYTKNLLKQIGQQTPVFFTHADSAIPSVPSWFAKLLLPTQWLALYIQPSFQAQISWGKRKSRQRFLAEQLFSLPSCKGVLLLHPVYTRFFRLRFQQDKFFLLPEIIDVAVDPSSEVADRIKVLANNRKIISITGSLLPKRNLELFLQSVQNLNPNNYFILIIGHLHLPNYTEEELKRINELASNLLNNSYIRFDYYIEEEEEFNRLLEISDVIYLQYLNHSHSSNILAKCIKLRKPVIVGSGYIMQKIINTYSWQSIVSEKVDQISELIINLGNHFEIDEVKYELFLMDHSEERFNLAIQKSTKMLIYSNYRSNEPQENF
ncbi:glycosyltransferase [Pseudanabaena sp. 'Roaring Creek']|uniref:glycosyltransferase n=1 Tax=Pseudanabaena sp. 'Roaring Creek' TaxID=1681830 RepID=UPI0006D7FB38|nr:glycosyltransferase [Pseudanabaena sp. 'Roaring Creek']